MARKRKSKKIYLIIFSIILIFSFIFNTSFEKIKKYIDVELFPYQSKIYKIGTSLSEIKDFKKIIVENENLKFENMKLKEKLFTLENIKEENRRLTEVLTIKEKYNYDKNVKVGRVIHKNIHNLYNRFHVDLGEKDGMEINMAVIQDNFLIGRVSEVLEDYSIVDLVSNPKVKVSAKTENGMLGVSCGSDEENGEIYFEPSTFKDGLKKGDVIYTSGISSIYPEGLLIGEIIEISENNNYLFKSIKVKPNYEVKKLREVIIYNYSKK